MDVKNSKGVSIMSTVAAEVMATLPNFDDPAKELAVLGLTTEMIKRVENGYATGQSIKKGA